MRLARSLTKHNSGRQRARPSAYSREKRGSRCPSSEVFQMKLLTIALSAGLTLAQTPETIPLWESRAPGALGDADTDRRTLTIFRAAGPQNVGTSVIVAPGGGYVNLSMDKEGRQVASWFNAMGI